MPLALFVALIVFFPAAAEPDDRELVTMRDAVVAAGGDWTAIEELLETLSPEDRELVIETYPDRLAELEEMKRAINETGANWTAGLNPVFLLPPERRGGVGTSPIPAEAEGAPTEIVTIGPSERGVAALDLPDSWDWRTAYGYDWTTPIKDQGDCGSCWAFGALGAIESRVKLASDNPGLVPDFSEQSLLSCSSGDCDGGYSDVTAYWILCEGTVDEACFPYVALDTVPCSDSCFDRDSRKYKSEGWSWVCGDWNIVDVNQIKQEVLTGGPVSTFMNVSTDFDAYTGGVYKHTYGTYRGGHSVDIVGWGNDGVDDYWICKNSWGTAWGEAGWFKIKMGEVSVGEQTIAYQPKVRGKVLFYEGHVPDFDFQLSDGYSEWGNRLASNGYLVHNSTMAPLTLDILECYDVVIISNPTVSFDSSEIAAIKEFVGRGRVIASGDGDLFADDFIYKQDNERMSVEYVDWLATGEGGGLLVMGEHQLANTAANQIANIFGLNFNSDIISDPKRYDTNVERPILGPENDVEVNGSCSLSISKDATSLAMATSSGYATVALAVGDGSDADELVVEANVDGLEPGDMLPADELSPASEDVRARVERAVPLAETSLSFAGPIGIAAVDFGRKGEDTVGVFSGGSWRLDYDNDGFSDYTISFGSSGDTPVSGDWNGDGKDTMGIFNAGSWQLDYDNDEVLDYNISFGSSGDIPVAGDWNGDGKDTIGIFNAGSWQLDYDNDGVSDYNISFGSSGDIPVAGDWNGDGRDTIGIFNAGSWQLDYDNNGIADVTIAFGASGDTPAAGDWNGNGRDTIGIFNAGSWQLDYDNDGVSDAAINFGSSGDVPVGGDWLKYLLSSGNPVAYYPFDGNANDASGNGNHGTAYGATLTQDRFGNPNRAYLFDGIDDYIYAPVNINPDVMPKVTMTAWVKANDVASVRQVISTDNGGLDRTVGIDNRLSGTCCWSAFIGTGLLLGDRPVNPGEWVFLAVVYDQDESTVKIYVNGDCDQGNGVLGAGYEYIHIGSNPGYGEYFNGVIDDVHIYNRVLSDAEILELYHEDGLVAYYPLEGNANDISGNGYHGTVYGATLTQDRFGNPNRAYQFDGVNDYILAPVNINPDVMPKVTMTAWVKANDVASVRQVISTDNGGLDRTVGIDNRLSGTCCWSAFIGTGLLLGDRPVNPGEWVFLAVVYDQDESTVKIYVNGDCDQGNGVLGAGYEYIHIGSNPSYGEYFNGVIDDVRIYNRALSEAEVQMLYS